MKAHENPATPRYVYRCFDKSGRLIYVGRTSDLFQRLASHSETKWWGPQIHKTTAKVYKNLAEASVAERKAIHDENPRWNIIGKWGHRHQWTVADCEDHITALQNHGSWIPDSTQGRIEELRRLIATQAIAA